MASHTTTVTIVDDDQGIRETVRMVLEDEGYPVVEASSGVDALRVLRYSPTGMVVLLDEHLRGISGMDILDLVEFYPTLQRHSYLSFTVTPHRFTAADQATLYRLGIPIVAKPFDLDDLLRAVAEAAARLPSLDRPDG